MADQAKQISDASFLRPFEDYAGIFPVGTIFADENEDDAAQPTVHQDARDLIRRLYSKDVYRGWIQLAFPAPAVTGMEDHPVWQNPQRKGFLDRLGPHDCRGQRRPRIRDSVSGQRRAGRIFHCEAYGLPKSLEIPTLLSEGCSREFGLVPLKQGLDGRLR